MEERLSLFEAASEGNIKEVEHWLQQDSMGVFTEDDKGWTPLFHAVAANQLAIVKYLLKKRASVVHRADGGLTALHVWAAQGEDSTKMQSKNTNKIRKKIWSLLLKSGANVNSTTANGNTPLSLACFHGNSAAVKLLLGKKLDTIVDTETVLGESPLELAKGNPTITKMLRSRGAQVKTLSAMPDEMLLHIFSYLPTKKDIFSISITCKAFQSLSEDDLLWKKFGSPTWIVAAGKWKTNVKEDTQKKILASQKLPIIYILLIGDTGVGKSSLIDRYLDDTFSESYNYNRQPLFYNRPVREKYFLYKGKHIKVNISEYENAGGYMRPVNYNPYRRQDGIMIVFDLTVPDTFSNAIKWNQEVDRYGRENTVRLLVGNKTDIASEQIEAAIDMASEWTDSMNYRFICTSSKAGQGVELAFSKLVEEIMERKEETEPRPKINTLALDPPNPGKPRCTLQ